MLVRSLSVALTVLAACATIASASEPKCAASSVLLQHGLTGYPWPLALDNDYHSYWYIPAFTSPEDATLQGYVRCSSDTTPTASLYYTFAGQTTTLTLSCSSDGAFNTVILEPPSGKNWQQETGYQFELAVRPNCSEPSLCFKFEWPGLPNAWATDGRNILTTTGGYSAWQLNARVNGTVAANEIISTATFATTTIQTPCKYSGVLHAPCDIDNPGHDVNVLVFADTVWSVADGECIDITVTYELPNAEQPLTISAAVPVRAWAVVGKLPADAANVTVASSAPLRSMSPQFHTLHRGAVVYIEETASAVVHEPPFRLVIAALAVCGAAILAILACLVRACRIPPQVDAELQQAIINGDTVAIREGETVSNLSFGDQSIFTRPGLGRRPSDLLTTASISLMRTTPQPSARARPRGATPQAEESAEELLARLRHFDRLLSGVMVSFGLTADSDFTARKAPQLDAFFGLRRAIATHDVIAAGGEAVVYAGQCASDAVGIRDVAVKLYRDRDAEALRQRVDNQLVALHGLPLTHPGLLLPIVSYRRGSDTIAIVMPRGEKNLAQLIRQPGAPTGRAADIQTLFDFALHVVDTVRFLHSQGLAHGDIKPSNFIQVEGGYPRLSDFGCVTRRGAASIEVRGTRRFLPPEYAAGRTVATTDAMRYAADTYMLGVTLLELFVGVDVTAPYLLGTLPAPAVEALVGALEPDWQRRLGLDEVAGLLLAAQRETAEGGYDEPPPGYDVPPGWPPAPSDVADWWCQCAEMMEAQDVHALLRIGVLCRAVHHDLLDGRRPRMLNELQSLLSMAADAERIPEVLKWHLYGCVAGVDGRHLTIATMSAVAGGDTSVIAVQPTSDNSTCVAHALSAVTGGSKKLQVLQELRAFILDEARAGTPGFDATSGVRLAALPAEAQRRLMDRLYQAWEPTRSRARFGLRRLRSVAEVEAEVAAGRRLVVGLCAVPVQDEPFSVADAAAEAAAQRGAGHALALVRVEDEATRRLRPSNSALSPTGAGQPVASTASLRTDPGVGPFPLPALSPLHGATDDAAHSSVSTTTTNAAGQAAPQRPASGQGISQTPDGAAEARTEEPAVQVPPRRRVWLLRDSRVYADDLRVREEMGTAGIVYDPVRAMLAPSDEELREEQAAVEVYSIWAEPPSPQQWVN